jgi:hypothetical protein
LAFGLAGAAQADKVRLRNGDVVTGKVIETTDTGIVLEHPVLGRLAIAADQIQARAADDAALPPPPKPPRPGLFGTSALAGWEKQIQLGFTGSSGNSDNQDYLVGVRGNYKDEHKRWQFDSGYFHSSSDGTDTKNQAFAMLLRDFLFTGKKTFAFASTRYDHDTFQDWDHRLNLAAGAGYSFVDRRPSRCAAVWASAPRRPSARRATTRGWRRRCSASRPSGCPPSARR